MKDNRVIIGFMGLAIVIALSFGFANVISSNYEIAKELHEINKHLNAS